MPVYLANDKYRSTTRATWIADPADTDILVTSIPTNVPTIVVLGWKTQYETIFDVESVSGDNSSNYTLSGVTKIRGFSGNIPEGVAVNCLNNEEFFNQYGSLIAAIQETADAAISPTSTSTLTNKRNQKRVDSQATTDTITPEISTYDIFVRSAQAHDLVINNHSTSTPADGEMMLFIILGDATPRAITYGNKYVDKTGTALPSTTVAYKSTKMLFMWRASLSQWDLLWAAQEI